MIVLLICTLIFIAGIVMVKNLSWDWEPLGILFVILGGGTLLIALVLIPINRNDCYQNIAKINAFRTTLENSRTKDKTDLERVSMLQKVTEWNEQIAVTKYMNTHLFDLWIPDEVENLKFIE